MLWPGAMQIFLHLCYFISASLKTVERRNRILAKFRWVEGEWSSSFGCVPVLPPAQSPGPPKLLRGVEGGKSVFHGYFLLNTGPGPTSTETKKLLPYLI